MGLGIPSNVDENGKHPQSELLAGGAFVVSGNGGHDENLNYGACLGRDLGDGPTTGRAAGGGSCGSSSTSSRLLRQTEVVHNRCVMTRTYI